MAVPMKTNHALISEGLCDIVANSCLLSMAVNWIVIYNNLDSDEGRESNDYLGAADELFH